jgi:hypothetical protein
MSSNCATSRTGFIHSLIEEKWSEHLKSKEQEQKCLNHES